jgi:putative Mg2+ transporter-C (MgtC) family protein
MPTDPAFQLDVSLRMLTAAALGAGLGLEREIHGHPAGMRTHMLVALGSAIFTILSIYGFPANAPGTTSSDPGRIAAQVVTGIGFLGAGAIVKYGASIRGLTTAGSLWVVAAVGLAAGAGAYFVAITGTAIGLIALWPLHILVQRLELAGGKTVHLRLHLKKLDNFGRVSQALLRERIEVRSVQSQKAGSGHDMDLEIKVANRERFNSFLADLEHVSGVEVESVSQAEEA